MYDANGSLQALVTKTTSFDGAGVDLGTGTPTRGLKARVNISAYISATTSGSTFTFTIQDSADNTTFSPISQGPAPILTGSTANQAVEFHIPFFTARRYVRSSLTIGASTGSPSVSYLVDIGVARP